MKTTNKNIIYNDLQIQNMYSILCGYYCIYYIEQRNEGRTADEVLLDFHDKPTEFNKKFMKFYVGIL